jgi:hypothetical protein
MSDPIDHRPFEPLVDSYTFHSPLPAVVSDLERSVEANEPGPSNSQTREDERIRGGEGDDEQGWVLGIDEAGRGR